MEGDPLPLGVPAGRFELQHPHLPAELAVGNPQPQATVAEVAPVAVVNQGSVDDGPTHLAIGTLQGLVQHDEHDTATVSVNDTMTADDSNFSSRTSDDNHGIHVTNNFQVQALAGLHTTVPSRAPQEIAEGDLRDHDGDHESRSTGASTAGDSDLPAEAVDAIYGRGIPEGIQDNPQGQSDPTVVTDLGDRLARATSLSYGNDAGGGEREPSPLYQALRSRRVPCGNNESTDFIPRGLLARIITPEAVEKELRRSSTAALKDSFRKQFPSLSQHISGSDLAAEARRVCGTGKLSFPKDQYHTHTLPERSQTAATPTSPLSPTGAPLSYHGTHQSPEPKQKSFRKIMAILILIGKPKKIRLFLEEDISDEDLPLELCRVTRNVGSSQFSTGWQLRSTRAKDQSKTVRCFRTWKPRAMEEFEKQQWVVLAPFFALGELKRVKISADRPRYRLLRTIHHWRLDDKVVLPFKSWSEAGAPGGCGQVYKVEIHPDHHVLNAIYAPNPNVFAVKQLFSRNEQDFKREVGMLKRLTCSIATPDPHPHLINLLATYQHQGLYHLIFPWADGDLVMFWSKETPDHSRDRDIGRWLVDQCRGLADGLATIHRYPTNTADSLYTGDDPKMGKPSQLPDDPDYPTKLLFGRHGDIKPANILWFRQDPNNHHPQTSLGILKLADFGVAEFTSEATGSLSSGAIANTVPYCAPEVLLRGGDVNSMNDIWSLGCVFLECVSWYIGGWDEVNAFIDLRSTPASHDDNPNIKVPTFYKLVEDPGCPIEACVKPEVVDYIYNLRHRLSYMTFMDRFVTLIQKHMLVAGLQAQRMAAARIARKLDGIMGRGTDCWAANRASGDFG